MISDTGQRFMAVAEVVAPLLSPAQATRAIDALLVLAAEGSQNAQENERQLRAGRADRDARGVDE